MHTIEEMTFRRRFCVNPYKKLRLPLGEMSCFKDWLNDRRGDPYPVVRSCEGEETLSESLPDARYRVENRASRPLFKARLLGRHFPYATYDIGLDELEAREPSSGVGMLITPEGLPRLTIAARRTGSGVCVWCAVEGEEKTRALECRRPFEPGTHLIVTCRGRSFDIYLQYGRKPEYAGTFSLPAFSRMIAYDVFSRTTAALFVSLAPGERMQGAAEFYLEGGISHADMKCMRYENGEPFMDRGRLFLTLSARLQAAGFQAVVSWNPSTDDIRMEGAIFFDAGDGLWCSDVATSAVFDRRSGEWYVWACSFSHGHVLCCGKSFADLRYGINVLDVSLMPFEKSEKGKADSLGAEDADGDIDRAIVSDDRLFFAKFGDEDPDLTFDEARGKWLLAICRLVDCGGKGGKYRYFLYESDDPLSGFSYVDHVREGDDTGGSFIRVAGRMYLLCGSGFDQRAQYHLHPIDDLSRCERLKFDYDDGGYRGWGTLIPVPCGRRLKYVMMTFDRHNGSDYNWSYGNIYVFEADMMNER
ncbi:MAG: hypothetical protein J5602_14255 [Clostridia bacterium]|nr:hypothetical protein [Clostridia bacterium]